jgi:hypothetical protein
LTGISQREFARLDGCDEKVVRRKIASGHLATNPDGTLDPELVGTDWRKRTYKKPDRSEPIDDHDLASLLDGPGFAMLTKPEAERRKENYMALLKQLEYDTKSGAVVLVEEVATAVVAEFARVRNKLLNIPTRVAPRAAMLKSADEVRALLEDEIALALAELTYDVKQL